MAERGLRGGGSVYQRSSDGRWVTRVEVPTLRGEPRKRVTRYSKTREEAEAKRAELVGDVPERPVGSRNVHLRNARTLGTHSRKEWRAMVAALPRIGPHRIACHYCDDPVHVQFVEKDHIIPVSRGGSDGLDNLAATCKTCNRAKGTLTGDEYLAMIGRKTWAEIGEVV